MTTPEEYGLPATLFGVPLVIEGDEEVEPYVAADTEDMPIGAVSVAEHESHQQQIQAQLQAAQAAIQQATQNQGAYAFPPGYVTESYSEPMTGQTSGFLHVEAPPSTWQLARQIISEALHLAANGNIASLAALVDASPKWKLVSHQVQKNVQSDPSRAGYGAITGPTILHLTLFRK